MPASRLWPYRAGIALVAGVVEPGGDMPVMGNPELFPGKTALVAGMFDDHETAGIDVPEAAGYNAADAPCAVMSTVQGQARFIPDLFGRQPVARVRDVGRVAQDRIETPVAQVAEPVRLFE